MGEELIKINMKAMYDMMKAFHNKRGMLRFYILMHYERSTHYLICSISKMARETGISRPSVMKYLKEMEEEGIIEKIQDGLFKVNFDSFPADMPDEEIV